MPSSFATPTLNSRLPFPSASLRLRKTAPSRVMPYIPYLYEFAPLTLAQVALTIWMLVDANRRGVEYHWFWIILIFQPIGAWAYFFLYKVKDFQDRPGWLGNLFQRRASLAELRHRAEQSPTPAS